MGNNVAEASIALSVDSTKLNQGMKDAANKAKKGADEVGKKFRDVSSEKIGAIFGGDSLIAGGAKAGAIGIAIGAVAMLGKELYNLATNAKEFEREMERSQEFNKQWGETVTTRIERTKESLREFEDVAGTAAGLKKWEKATYQAGNSLADLDQKVKLAEEHLKSFDHWYSSSVNVGAFVDQQFDGMSKQAKNDLDTAKAARDQQKKLLIDLQRQKTELTNPAQSQAARTALKQFVTEQQDAVKDLKRTADDKAIDKLKDKFGFKNGDLAPAFLAVTAKNAAQAGEFIKELNRDVKDLTYGFQRGGDDAKLEEMVKAGVDAKQLNRIQQLIERKKMLNQQYQGNAALEAGTWDAIKFKNETRFNDKRKQEFEAEGKQQEIIQQLIQLNLNVSRLNIKSPEV